MVRRTVMDVVTEKLLRESKIAISVTVDSTYKSTLLDNIKSNVTWNKLIWKTSEQYVYQRGLCDKLRVKLQDRYLALFHMM